MDKEHPIVARYLQRVEMALKEGDATTHERTQTIAMLCEQIEDALVTDGPADRIIAAMDPPSAYAVSDRQDEETASILGKAGLFLGLALAAIGLLVIPALFPHLRLVIGNPLVLASAIVSLAMGSADRSSFHGRASLLFGLMVSAFIAASSFFKALTG